MWANRGIGCLFFKFHDKYRYWAICSATYRQLSVCYEEHGQGCRTRVYTSVSAWSHLEKGSSWFQLSCSSHLLSDEGFVGCWIHVKFMFLMVTLMFFKRFQADVLPSFWRPLASLCQQIDFNTFLCVIWHRFPKGFLMAQALIDNATLIYFELLPFSSLDGDMLSDIHWFIGLAIVRGMYENLPLYISLC